ncbi:TraB/GumN family protein [Mediterranea sp. An20]|uniref:TraB/GumN family protein n=1 Tax=Mediterranea sp. An20 TaxID=1965586 RepID=UPI000B3AF619|nr:TraB/GumN family protein [Mediterranea sp. An20]OUP08793.1 TraB/GumN family protein [Mediterranea sp. An20]
MKRFITLVLLIAVTLGAQSQLLWKISGNGLQQPSYIFGTYHLSPLSIKDSIASLPQAMQDIRQVYGELVMADMMKPEFLAQMQQQTMLPNDTTLKSLFTPEEFEVVSRAVTEYLQVDIALLDRMKPAALFQQLTVLFYMKHTPGYNPQEQLDASFQQEATEQGKKVGGLETAQSQVDILFNKPLRRQAEDLYCFVSDPDKVERQVKEIIAAYTAQDLDKMLQLMEEKEGTSCDPTPEEMAQLLYDRNQAWVKQMPAIMQAAPTLFVVGAGHLPGEQGVLALLKAQDYTVEPMK